MNRTPRALAALALALAFVLAGCAGPDVPERRPAIRVTPAGWVPTATASPQPDAPADAPVDAPADTPAGDGGGGDGDGGGGGGTGTGTTTRSTAVPKSVVKPEAKPAPEKAPASGCTNEDGNIAVRAGATCTLSGARVPGNINVDAGAVHVANVRVNGNLQCEGNSPAPTGGGNQVSGNKEGQCVGL